MEITRKTEIIVETQKQIVFSELNSAAAVYCPRCAGLMLTAEQCAAVFGITRRTVYRLVETKPHAHLTETAAGIVFLCAKFFADSENI